MGIQLERDGSGVIVRERDRATLAFPAGTSEADRQALADAFLGSDLSMPETIPTSRVRQYLINTGQKAAVVAHIGSLLPGNKPLAQEAFDYQTDFDTRGALAGVVKAALSFDDAGWANFCRQAAAYKIDSYGDPKPSFMASLAEFLGFDTKS